VPEEDAPPASSVAVGVLAASSAFFLDAFLKPENMTEKAVAGASDDADFRSKGTPLLGVSFCFSTFLHRRFSAAEI
jgi:hypothetical protein